MGEVVKLGGLTRLNLRATDILEEIAKEDPKNVFVVTWNDEGDGNYTFHSNIADAHATVYAAQKFIHKMMNGDFIL